MKLRIILLTFLFSSLYYYPQQFFYSFENTYSGWDTVGIDLELGDSLIDWSIHPSNELAADSIFSLKFYLENYNDAGKIWIQKPFPVEQNTNYIVTFKYKFASSDFGLANLWTIIAGIHLNPPDSANDLIFQGHTGNGFGFDTGFVWLDKNYEFNLNTNSGDSIWAVIGIWGNWETPRIYYVDSLTISVEEDSLNSIPTGKKIPDNFYLMQNYPNPFNPTTLINYNLPGNEFVSLTIYNSLGEMVEMLVNEFQSAGLKTVIWNGEDDNGNPLSSGIYIYRIIAGDQVDSKKMLLLR